jgi:hypothetical protein
MKKILAIGGAVIKTAWDEVKAVAEKEEIEMLIHNGASLFHDFQRATDKRLAALYMHSYPLNDLLNNKDFDREASEIVWEWIRGRIKAPKGSLTRICEEKKINVLCFTALGCDFWQLFDPDWESFARNTRKDFYFLCRRMGEDNFHYVLLGSAVIHPEVFAKAVAMVRPKNFRADVVDFLEMYRPKTRVACYGNYYKIEFKEFLSQWLDEVKDG